ncbi:arylformamidase [Ophidiomyces ophidiicola]|nr:arylformamidase [Ophidiomyces ophidiicola]KAI2172079.1 arylformamidase [Ophidiomyces ophidiicola]KAI2182503.1 arylformamidase [Ophidiomyces ophidiicola]KAI2202447.1 arylformamidase [Ophidiomyces ophidiicola]KAI2232802.1 arylformamidase [Ophidiomyces ophidiicola]
MGQGFFGYNPPKLILDAAKSELDNVVSNQYAPTRGNPRLKKAIAEAYSPFFEKRIDPETEVVITSGANEGMLSAFMGFVEPGDEVIIFEPFFDQYNIEMPGGTIKYVPLHPPKEGAVRKTRASEWSIDFQELEKAFNEKTRMIVGFLYHSPLLQELELLMTLISGYQYPVRHNPVGKILSLEELEKIALLCVKYNTIIVSDEVYDRLYYAPFPRIATLSPQIAERTLTVGSVGKNFYATGWRVGYLIGPEHLIKYVAAAHTRICYSSVAPLQAAAAIGFEKADQVGFWDQSRQEMRGKIDRFCEVLDELGIPYTDPDGGYFVLANMAAVKLPESYPFPPHIAGRPRDFKLFWFLAMEFGVGTIPPTEFYTDANAYIGEDWIRFAICKPDEDLEEAKTRLRGLQKYMVK